MSLRITIDYGCKILAVAIPSDKTGKAAGDALVLGRRVPCERLLQDLLYEQVACCDVQGVVDVATDGPDIPGYVARYTVGLLALTILLRRVDTLEDTFRLTRGSSTSLRITLSDMTAQVMWDFGDEEVTRTITFGLPEVSDARLH